MESCRSESLLQIGGYDVGASVGANGQVVFTSTMSCGYIASSLTASLGGKMPLGMGSVLTTADVTFLALRICQLIARTGRLLKELEGYISK